MTMAQRTALELLGAVVWLCPSLLAAQVAPRGVVGVVRDQQGRPVAEALIEGGRASARTDASGRFRLETPAQDSLTISVRRIGFIPLTAQLHATELRADTLYITLDENALTLDRVTVNAPDLRSPLGLGSFEERRATGNGVFVTRAEIERRNTSRLSDVVRGRRGVQLVRLRNGSYGVQFATFSGRNRTARCTPELWLDGVRARGMELDDIPANTVEAIELYHSYAITPFQFAPETAGNQRCGTIVVWTRIPDSR